MTGSEKLCAWLDVRGHGRADLARAVRISEPYASQLCTGRRFPSAEVMARIETWTGGGVRMMDWRDPASLREYRPKRSRVA